MKYRLIQSVVTLGARLPSSQNALCDSGRSNGLTFSVLKTATAQNTKIEIKSVEMNGVTNLRGDSCCEQKGSMWSQSLRTKTDNGQQMRMKKLSFCFLTWMKTCGRLFFLNEWTLSALDYTHLPTHPYGYSTRSTVIYHTASNCST